MVVRCPYCKSVLRIDETRAKSRKIKCPKCKKIMKAKEEVPLLKQADSKTIIANKERVLDENIPQNLNIQVQVLNGEGGVFHLKKSKTVFGRSDGDFNINDPNVSKKHMVIEVWSRDNIYVRDLSSTNGTFLNGTRIITSKLQDGDLLQIGSTKLRVVIKEP
jgi:predicted Zn finger-like uncharacterized protein